MRMSVLQTLLCLFLVLSINSASSQPDLLYHRLMAFGMATQVSQEFLVLLSLQFFTFNVPIYLFAGLVFQDLNKNDQQVLLSQLSLPDSELKGSEVSTLGSKQDLTGNLEQSAEISDSLWPRERKAGCKSFYWKGFTSC
ncbi:somatostatin 1.2 [Trichomycterus rosablanca]|uniref:somatostatin 1.2 n=1 Tax=Trichomycterus rosablanca TaxID=2290929 RepID=UPI002F35F3F0